MTQPPCDTTVSHHDPDDFSAAQDRGDCHASLGRHAAARRDYERAANLAPDDPRPYIGLGVVAYQEGDVDEADTAFRVALRLDPRSSRAYAGLALVAQNRNDSRGAFDCYMKSLERDPDNLTALLGLFQTSCRMGSFGQVTYYLELYLHGHPEDTSVMFSLAALYVKDGSLVKAKRVLAALLARRPDSQEARDLLEEVEHSLTREVAAQTIFPLPPQRSTPLLATP